jgi:hypothetical protein
MAETMRQLTPPSASPCASSHLTISHRGGQILVGCCISPSTGSHQNSWPQRFLYFIFLLLNSSPKTTSKHPPPHVPPGRISSQMPTPPPTPSFGWLLHQPTKQQPPKTRAPPISQFFDRFHLGAPNKGIRRSAQEPGRRAPEVDSSGAAAQRFGSMADGSVKIKGKAAGNWVATAHLVLCVLCAGVGTN